MGVHTNVCMLNRSFGARQMTHLGFHVVLVGDLTDTMYDPRSRLFVSHTGHGAGHRAYRGKVVHFNRERRPHASAPRH
jgi:hypothetical protein